MPTLNSDLVFLRFLRLTWGFCTGLAFAARGRRESCWPGPGWAARTTGGLPVPVVGWLGDPGLGSSMRQPAQAS